MGIVVVTYPSKGDMLKEIYDADHDNVIDAGCIPNIDASKITSGDLNASRMKANIETAINSKDVTLTSITFDEHHAIKRGVADSQINIYGGTGLTDGAIMQVFGADHATLPGYARFYIGDKREGAAPNSKFDIFYNTNGNLSDIFRINKYGDIELARRGDFNDGVRVGSNTSYSNQISDSSLGTTSDELYIGNAIIATAFTGFHYYQLGDTDLQSGELVKLVDGKIYRTTKKADKQAIGIYQGNTNIKDSFGKINGSYAYSVAVIGDSYSEHDTHLLRGAWVTTKAGTIEEGDLLVSSDKPGYLQKQKPRILSSTCARLDYTVAVARQKVTKDMKTAYVELVG